MSRLILEAASVRVNDDDPDGIVVTFRGDDESRYVALEQFYHPAYGDSRYVQNQVSLDFDLRPEANAACTPGVIAFARLSPESLELEMRPDVGAELSGVEIIEIRFHIGDAKRERLRTALEFYFGEHLSIVAEPELAVPAVDTATEREVV